MVSGRVSAQRGYQYTGLAIQKGDKRLQILNLPVGAASNRFVYDETWFLTPNNKKNAGRLVSNSRDVIYGFSEVCTSIHMTMYHST